MNWEKMLHRIELFVATFSTIFEYNVVTKDNPSITVPRVKGGQTLAQVEPSNIKWVVKLIKKWNLTTLTPTFRYRTVAKIANQRSFKFDLQFFHKK